MKKIIILLALVVLLVGCVEYNGGNGNNYSIYDVNQDGLINMDDIDSISNHYGETGPPGWIRQDINEDGVIDILDIDLVAVQL